jgi:hypothetical protein
MTCHLLEVVWENVLQVRSLVSPARKKKSYVGDKIPRYRLVAATQNLSQAARLVISY